MDNPVLLDCLAIFQAGVEAVDPCEAVKKYLHLVGDQLSVGGQTYQLSRFKNIHVIGAGKAGAAMARAVEEILGDRITGGLVVVKYGHRDTLSRIKLVEAGHPVPDDAGLQGARALVDLVSSSGRDDLILCLLSGGASALLPLPVPGVSLEEKQVLTRLLLKSGATISEVNTIRKHLSRVKGGGIARLVYPATVISLILSDVIGDDLEVIASGPTVPDQSTFSDCLKILEKYQLIERIPTGVRTYLGDGVEGKRPETPKPGDPVFQAAFNLIVGSNRQCLEAAEVKARELGYHTLILSSFVEGETREVAKVHAAILKEILTSGRPLSKPACVLSGGETTVTIRGNGKGGRNQEFVLAAGLEIQGWLGAAVFSAGTDGTDGFTDAAGAFADWRMGERARKLGLDPPVYLRNNDSYHFFERLEDLVVTGPTHTNVMDLRLLVAT